MITFLPLIYHATDEPPTITLNGVTYDRIERLPRNAREGDVVRLFDGNDPRGPHYAFAEVTGVDSWPQTIRGYRRFAPEVYLHLRYLSGQEWRFWPKLTYRDSETRRPTSLYRPRKAA